MDLDFETSVYRNDGLEHVLKIESDVTFKVIEGHCHDGFGRIPTVDLGKFTIDHIYIWNESENTSEKFSDLPGEERAHIETAIENRCWDKYYGTPLIKMGVS